MFSFDEELFNEATDCIKNAREQFDDLNTIIDSIANTSETDEIDKSKIIINTKAVKDKVEELECKAKRTKEIYELSIKEYQLLKIMMNIFNPAFDKEPDKTLEEIFQEMLEMSISPYSYQYGRYGGFQEAPSELFEKYILSFDSLSEIDKKKMEIINRMLEECGICSDNEKAYALVQLAKTGCGFAVIANTLCDVYKNKPEEFKEKFGYPLVYYTEEGLDYNFETILVDTFLKTYKDIVNDKMKGINYTDNNGWNKIFSIILSYTADTSVHYDDIATMLNSFDSNISGTFIKRDLSVDIYKDYMDQGYDYACLAVRRFTLTPYGNNKDTGTKSQYFDGGHWMSITGLTEDNKYIVSSWGEEWILEKGSAYAYKEPWLFGTQELHDNDGGLVFFKVGDEQL